MKRIFGLLLTCLLLTGCDAYKDDSEQSNQDDNDSSSMVTITIPNYFLPETKYFVEGCSEAITEEDYLACALDNYDDAHFNDDSSLSITISSDEASDGMNSSIENIKMNIVEEGASDNIENITYDDTLSSIAIVCKHALSDYKEVAYDVVVDALCYQIYSCVEKPFVEVYFFLTDGTSLESLSSDDLSFS